MGSIGRYSALGKMSVVLQRAYLAYAGAYCIGMSESPFSAPACTLGRLGDARRGQHPVRAGCNIPTPAIYYFLLIITVRDNDYPAMPASEKIRYVSAYLTDIMPTVCVPVA